MAANQKKKRATAVRVPVARVFAGSLDELTEVLAGKIASRLAPRDAVAPSPAQPYEQSTAAPKPPSENTKELVKDINLKTNALAQRLSELESNLRGEPLSGSNTASPSPCSLNGTLDDTLTVLGAAHQVVTRIGVYVGIEV